MPQVHRAFRAAGSVDFIVDVTMSRLETWRERAAVLQALITSRWAVRSAILDECLALQTQILDARTELIFELATTNSLADPGQIAHFEKALDGVVRTLREIERHCRS